MRALVVAHVLFAQLTLVVAVAFVLVTRVTRWRLSWLAAPAVIGLAWTAAVGPRAAAAGLAEGPARIVGFLGAGGHQAAHVLHFTAAFTGIGGWLPRQLPLAILTGTAEAAIIGWLSWLHTAAEPDAGPPRPAGGGPARRGQAGHPAGGVVTRDGGCLGIAEGSGARVTVSWPETAGGVAVCGSAGPDVLTAGFQLVHAAIRRRKPVLAVDLTAEACPPGSRRSAPRPVRRCRYSARTARPAPGPRRPATSRSGRATRPGGPRWSWAWSAGTGRAASTAAAALPTCEDVFELSTRRRATRGSRCWTRSSTCSTRPR